jgi:hypothetical protein
VEAGSKRGTTAFCSRALLDFGRAGHHQRDKSGQCERENEESESHQSQHDSLPFGVAGMPGVMGQSCWIPPSADVMVITQ